jgi:hypothetical protein
VNDYFLLLFKSLKQQKWRHLLEDLEEGNLYRILWFSSKSASREFLPPKDHDKHQQAELLFKGTSATNVPIDLSNFNLDLLCRFSSYPLVTKEEVALAIQKIRPKNAPGIDGIANELLQSFSEPLALTLKKLYNDILIKINLPASWKISVTEIIWKHSKLDYTNRGAYQPIALLSTMISKLFELILARQLMAWAKQAGVIANKNFGGRKGSGTKDA